MLLSSSFSILIINRILQLKFHSPWSKQIRFRWYASGLSSSIWWLIISHLCLIMSQWFTLLLLLIKCTFNNKSYYSCCLTKHFSCTLLWFDTFLKKSSKNFLAWIQFHYKLVCEFENFENIIVIIISCQIFIAIFDWFLLVVHFRIAVDRIWLST